MAYIAVRTRLVLAQPLEMTNSRSPVSLDNADDPTGRLLDLWLCRQPTGILSFLGGQLCLCQPRFLGFRLFIVRIVILERNYKQSAMALL
jgi:hypothetical protein